MKTLCTIYEVDIYPESEKIIVDEYKKRRAARAIVLNDKDEVALLKVKKHLYHKLPGGGIEPREDISLALKRELLEELGCTARITSELGVIVEFRDQWKLEQTSYCFVAKQYGDIKSPDFTKEELEEGFEVKWAKNLDEAIKLLEHDTPDNYDGKFIMIRDQTFLREYKERLSN